MTPYRKRPKRSESLVQVRLRAKLEYRDELLKKGIPKSQLGTVASLSKEAGVSQRATQNLLKLIRDGTPEPKEEKRGRKPLLTPESLRTVEGLITQHGIEGKTPTFELLVLEAGLTMSPRTLRRYLRALHWRQCLVCDKVWISYTLAEWRVDFARTMLEKYPYPDNWKCVRFSHKVHVCFGPEGRAWQLRKAGERLCPDCLETNKEPKEEDDLKRLHCWMAVGWNYKSDLVKYNPGHGNVTMTHTAYLDILEKVVKHWPPEAVLEDDNDGGHGKGVNSPVRSWKRTHGLKYYFGCQHSADLSPVEDLWQPPTQHEDSNVRWKDDTMWEFVSQSWLGFSQIAINNWVLEMPNRLQRVLANYGQLPER